MSLTVLGARAVIGVVACGMAWNGLKGAERARENEDWPWARFLMVLATIWAAAAAIIGAITVGGLQ